MIYLANWINVNEAVRDMGTLRFALSQICGPEVRQHPRQSLCWVGQARRLSYFLRQAEAAGVGGGQHSMKGSPQ
jgi:hypothetical protein